MRTKIRWVSGVLIILTMAAGANAQTCDWEWVNPVPPRTDIYRLKYEVNAFVGVGKAGIIIRSPDGYLWNVVSSGVDSDLFGVEWGGGSFVAVGDGVILTSAIGNDWSTVYVNESALLLDVEYSVSRFVAVGGGLDGYVLMSPLGVDWDLVEVPWSGRADSIAGSDEGFYVAVGAEIWFSPDGFSWSHQSTVPASQTFAGEGFEPKITASDLFTLDRVDLAWTGSRLLWAGGSELFSSDLESDWGLVTTLGGCRPFSDWLGLSAGPGWAVASGISGCPSPFLDPDVTIMISVDGGATFRTPWEGMYGGFPGLARFGSRWVAAGALGDVLTSSDGATWNCDHGECTSLACADRYVDLTSGDDMWLTVGGVGLCDDGLKRRSGGTVARSDRGNRWAVEKLSENRFRGVAYLEPEFIGLGGNWIGRSRDGITWDFDDSPDGAVFRGIGSGDGLAVAVGEGGDLFVTDDGRNFGKRFHLVTADLNRVIFNDGLFIVLGRGGTIMRSTDSLNWSSALTNTTVDLNGAAGEDGRWIAVGDDGVILGSEDVAVWGPRRSGVTSSLMDVIWARDRFVAVGWDEHPDGTHPGVILISSDGVGWTRLPAPGEELRRIAWNDGSWLVVGGERTIMESACLGLHFDIETQHLHVPHGETVDLFVRLSDDADADTPISVVSSHPGSVVVPNTVTVLAGSDTVFVPVTGEALASDVVLSLSLPGQVGGGSTTVLATVQPPEGRPRRPSGRVRP